MTQRTFGGRPMEFDMDGGLEEGTALAVAADGIKCETIRIPEQLPPEWAVKVTLSPEDYGRLLRFHSDHANHLG